MIVNVTRERVVQDPVLQAAIVGVVAVIIAGLEKLANVISMIDSEPRSPWIIMTSFILFYALFNSILSLKSSRLNRYWGRGIMSFIGLCVVTIAISTAFSSLSIDEAGTFRWLFLVLAVGYLVFLTIVRLMRKIVDIAIKQDEKLRGK